MVSYATGSCSEEERDEFETHLLSCDECVAMLAILAIVLREKALSQPLRSGVEAARIAREGQKRKSRHPRNRLTSKQHAAAR